MKAPQERKRRKRLTTEDRERMEWASILLGATDDTLTITKQNERPDRVVIRGREEVEMLRDWCNAWLRVRGREYEEES